MKLTGLKNIMKEVNEPNEFELFSHDLQHPFYWIFKIEGVRLKTLYSELVDLRKPSARFDVFINGLFISENDYIVENKGNAFYIKFIKQSKNGNINSRRQRIYKLIQYIEEVGPLCDHHDRKRSWQRDLVTTSIDSSYKRKK